MRHRSFQLLQALDALFGQCAVGANIGQLCLLTRRVVGCERPLRERQQCGELILKNTGIEPVTAIYWLLANPGQSLARLLSETQTALTELSAQA